MVVFKIPSNTYDYSSSIAFQPRFTPFFQESSTLLNTYVQTARVQRITDYNRWRRKIKSPTKSITMRQRRKRLLYWDLKRILRNLLGLLFFLSTRECGFISLRTPRTLQSERFRGEWEDEPRTGHVGRRVGRYTKSKKRHGCQCLSIWRPCQKWNFAFIVILSLCSVVVICCTIVLMKINGWTVIIVA